MSNYTNRSLFDNNIIFNDKIGGDKNDITHSKEYMTNQIEVIKSNTGKKIFIEDDNTNNKNKDSHTEQSNPHQNKNYIPFDKRHDRYDPYEGYLSKYGLNNRETYNQKDIVYVNIDSKFRRKEPSIISSDVILLQNNPIRLFHNSNIMRVTHLSHGYKVNELVTLNHIINKVSVLKTVVGGVKAIDFINESTYATIKFNHGISQDYTGGDITADISGIVGGVDSSYLGNIPINSINKIHSVLLIKPKEDTVPAEPYSSDTFYILLPKEYSGTYIPNNYNFKIKMSSIGGISTSYLNAAYPIDTDHRQGYFSINSITDDTYDIIIKNIASIDTNIKTGTENGVDYLVCGGSNVVVSKVTHVLAGYTNPNKYKISLGKTYNNVSGIRLVSSEFPNSKQVIRSLPEETRNNRIYWQNLDDGDHMYHIEIDPGNYGPTNLVAELQNKFYATQRVSLSGNEDIISSYTKNHYVRADINTSTNVVEFRSYKEAILIKPFTNISPDIDENSSEDTFSGQEEFKITVTHPNHGLYVGNKILVQQSITHMGIPASILNIEHQIIEVDDENSYKFILPKFNLSSSGRTNTKGGVAVYIYVPDSMRLRFDLSDTLGEVLGFRNPGNSTSITKYAHIITNKDPYEVDTTINALGEASSITNNFVNLGGDDYFLMVIKRLGSIYNNGPIKESFSKILLTDTPGKVMYNSYISAPKFFKEPINIDELEFEFYSPDGTLFDFSGLDHSFTLRLESDIEFPKGTRISSKTGKVST